MAVRSSALGNGNGNGAQPRPKPVKLVGDYEPASIPLEDVGASQSLDERISSGEFTDVGSTKDRLIRPIRELLARDPFGPGRHLPACALVNAGQCSVGEGLKQLALAEGHSRESALHSALWQGLPFM